MGPIGSPETSAGNYHYSLRDNPDERSSHAQASLYIGMVVCLVCVCPINIPLLATLAVAYVAIPLENPSGLFH